MSNLPALPKKSTGLTATQALQIEKRVRIASQETADLDQLDDYRRKMAALSAYHHGKGAAPYLLASERLLEARIGQLLGAAKQGKPGHHTSVTTEVKRIPRMDRHAFRILARGFEVNLPDEEWRQSRRQLIATLKPLMKANNRAVRRSRMVAELKHVAAERAIIRHGDCMTALSDVGPIDLLLTDPPYFTDGDFTAQVSAFLARVKPTGTAYVFASADPDELAAYLAMDRHGMTLAQMLAWNYNNTGQRQPSARYNSNYQIVFYFRGEQAPPINKPSDGTHQYACQTVNAPDGRIGDRFHAWQKPLALLERYILNSSKPNDLVCDPFAGTGTALLAAAKHGRRAIGCDTDKAAVQIALQLGCVR